MFVHTDVYTAQVKSTEFMGCWLKGCGLLEDDSIAFGHST